jgi:type IV pilus assembly protein PilV
MNAASRSRQTGIGLIEILVTILILMFGLLGVAGLLTKGVSNASTTEARSKANQLLADMADRIRSNPTVALSATSEYITGFTAAAPTGSTIAAQDLVAWKAAISSQLPNGQGSIANSASGTGGRKVTLSIRWSACLGTLSQAALEACILNPETSYETVTMELML